MGECFLVFQLFQRSQIHTSALAATATTMHRSVKRSSDAWRLAFCCVVGWRWPMVRSESMVRGVGSFFMVDYVSWVWVWVGN